jgi:kinetochore protein Nuf2
MNQSLSTAHQGNYVYPTLPPDEIVACLTELFINITTDDLARPTPGKMQLIYTGFADIIMGVTSEAIEASKAACEQEADHPDIFADTFLLMIFYRQLQVLMREVGFPQFSLQDITKPEPRRVQHCLSAIINFAKFREERLGVYEQFTTKAADYAEQHEQLSATHHDLSERVELLRVQRVREEPLVAKAKQVNEGLTAELYDLKRVEGQTMAEYDQLKGIKAELTDHLHQVQTLRQNTERDVAKVKARIVHSPEQLKQGLRDMSIALKEERQRIADKKKLSHELVAKFDTFTQLERDLEACVRLMEECKAELQRVEAARTKLNQFEESVDGKRLEVRELSVRETQLQRQLTSSTERLQRVARQRDAKRDAQRARMARIEEELREMHDGRMQMDTEIDKKRAVTEAIRGKIDALREELNTEVNGINLELAKLDDHVSLYMTQVSQAMQHSALVV